MDVAGVSSTSIIMEHIIGVLKEINDSSLTSENITKKNHLINLCEKAKNVKVVDSRNLKTVFDLFRHPRIKFE